LEHFRDQVVLALEMIVHRAFAHPGGARDVAHAGVRVAGLGEGPHGGFEHLSPAGFALLVRAARAVAGWHFSERKGRRVEAESRGIRLAAISAGEPNASLPTVEHAKEGVRNVRGAPSRNANAPRGIQVRLPAVHAHARPLPSRRGATPACPAADGLPLLAM